jgi:hypothetical protein
MTDLRIDQHPIPEENRPGHHPGRDQDKPDLDAFRQRAARPLALLDTAEAEAQAQAEAAATPVFPDHGIFGTIGYASLGLATKAVHALTDRG